jgi:hypothetical protein
LSNINQLIRTTLEELDKIYRRSQFPRQLTNATLDGAVAMPSTNTRIERHSRAIVKTNLTSVWEVLSQVIVYESVICLVLHRQIKEPNVRPYGREN